MQLRLSVLAAICAASIPVVTLPNRRHPPGLIPAKTARNIGAILVRFMPLAASARTNHRWICPRWKQLPTIARNSIMSRCFIPSNITVTQFRRPLRKVCRHCIWATRFCAEAVPFSYAERAYVFKQIFSDGSAFRSPIGSGRTCRISGDV